jgi:tetratricopeptide (TPR) repeat protein
LSPATLSHAAVQNSLFRAQKHLTLIGDFSAEFSIFFEILAVLILAGLLFAVTRDMVRPPRALFSIALLLLAAGAWYCSRDEAEVRRSAQLYREQPTSRAELERRLGAEIQRTRQRPPSPAGLRDLGLVYYRYGQVEGAAACFTDAFLLDPQELVARYGLFHIASFHGPKYMPKEALLAERARLNTDSPEDQLALGKVLVNRGLFLLRQKDQRMASLFLSRAAQSSLGLAPVRKAAREVMTAQGESETSIRQFMQALTERQPTQIE